MAKEDDRGGGGMVTTMCVREGKKVHTRVCLGNAQLDGWVARIERPADDRPKTSAGLAAPHQKLAGVTLGHKNAIFRALK